MPQKLQVRESKRAREGKFSSFLRAFYLFALVATGLSGKLSVERNVSRRSIKNSSQRYRKQILSSAGSHKKLKAHSNIIIKDYSPHTRVYVLEHTENITSNLLVLGLSIFMFHRCCCCSLLPLSPPASRELYTLCRRFLSYTSSTTAFKWEKNLFCSCFSRMKMESENISLFRATLESSWNFHEFLTQIFLLTSHGSYENEWLEVSN